MSAQAKISDAISKKQLEIQELELKIAEARQFIKGLEEAIKLLPKEEPLVVALRDGSDVYKAREAILAIGRPLHINELLKMLGKPDNDQAKASLTSTITNYVNKNKIFKRVAPATFGVIGVNDDWENLT